MPTDRIIDMYAYLIESSSLPEADKDLLIKELQEKGITDETKKKILESLKEIKKRK